MNMKFVLLFYFLFFACHVNSDKNDVFSRDGQLLSSYFSDNMVLQRGEGTTIWGSHVPKTAVLVEIGSMKYETITDENGSWSVTIKSYKAGGPYNIIASSEDIHQILNNVYFGDVWMCAGQSNMTWPLKKTKKDLWNFETDSIFMSHLGIKKTLSLEPSHSVNTLDGGWQSLDSPLKGNFSALAYHFGKHVKANLNVPIGLVHISYPDSRIEAWLSDRSNSNIDTGKPYDIASVIHNGMIKPLEGLKIKGVLWYQGESNNLSKHDSFLYRYKLKQLILDMRSHFESKALPFLIVGLPNYESIPVDGNANWAVLRESQAKAAELDFIGIVPTIDLGESNELHPKNKEAVGRRAADVALDVVYGVKNGYNFPSLDTIVVDSISLTLHFSNSYGKLISAADTITGFSLIRKNGFTENVVASIEDSTLTIQLQDPRNIDSLKYAWENDPRSLSLFNASALPISSFRCRVQN